MKLFKAIAITAALTASSASYAAVTIEATSTTPTLIGTFDAGTYTFTTTGIVSLAGPIGSGFDMDANGVPVTPVTSPGYLYFNPGGSDTADGSYGNAGPGFNLGALVGTFAADGASGYFLLGTTSTLTFNTTTSLYGLVNETYAINDAGAFSVSAAAAAVPEPSTWAMMILGFGVVGGALRRRQQVRYNFA